MIWKHGLLTVRLTGWYICEEQEAEVFRQRKGQAQAAEWTLREFRGEACLVKFEVGERDQQPRCRVQSNAEPPYVALGTQAYRGTDRWQVVRNLQTYRKDSCFGLE